MPMSGQEITEHISMLKEIEKLKEKLLLRESAIEELTYMLTKMVQRNEDMTKAYSRGRVIYDLGTLFFIENTFQLPADIEAWYAPFRNEFGIKQDNDDWSTPNDEIKVPF